MQEKNHYAFQICKLKYLDNIFKSALIHTWIFLVEISHDAGAFHALK